MDCWAEFLEWGQIICISNKFPSGVDADAVLWGPHFENLSDCLIDSPLTTYRCLLITFCDQECLMFIPHLNRKFSGGQLLLKDMTVDIGYKTCLVKHITNCGRLCGTYIYLKYYFSLFPTHSFLLFAKLLNFFTKSGSFGRERLWYSNFLQPFSLKRFNTKRNTFTSGFPLLSWVVRPSQPGGFFSGSGEWDDFFFFFKP